MKKKKNATDTIELELMEIRLLDDETAETASENPADSPLLNEFRSLAKIQFILCHSLPAVNANGATWTYPTLVNSVKTVRGQVINLNHLLKDNQKLLSVKSKIEDRAIGYMIDGDIKLLEQDDNGLYPLSPDQPVAIIVTGYLWKRIVPELIARLKRGEKLKISMECEFTEVGFIYEGVSYTRMERPEFLGKRDFNGKPVIRVLGGLDPKGGVVNFWGAAVLDKQNPADKDAEVLSAVASEIGENPPETLIDEENADMKNFLDRLPKEIAALLKPLLEATVDEINDENVAKALLEYAQRIKELESEMEQKINQKDASETETETPEGEGDKANNETPVASDKAEIVGSLEEQLCKVKDSLKDGLYKNQIFDSEDNFWISGVLPTSVILEVWEEGYGNVNYQVPYAVLEDGTLVFGQKTRVELKQVVAPYTGPLPDPEEEESATENNEGEKSNMAKNKTGAPGTVAPEVAEETVTEETQNDKNTDATVAEELAAVKSRLEQLLAEKLELQRELDSLKAEKEAANRKAVLATRKEKLAEDFDLDDLLDAEEEETIAGMSDEAFNAYAARMKKVASKSKFTPKNGKTIDLLDPQVPTVDGTQNKKSESQHKKVSLAADESEEGGSNENEENPSNDEVANTTKPVQQPRMPEFPVNKDLKSKFGKF